MYVPSYELIHCHAFIVGKEGPVTQALFNLIVDDMKSGPSSVRIPVPY